MTGKMILAIAALLQIFCTATAFAGHWPAPLAMTSYMHLAGQLTIEGEPPRAGDEVGVFDQNGNIIGLHVIDGTNGNYYGDLAVSGEAPGPVTAERGARDQELLTVKVWSASRKQEYRSGELKLSPTDLFAAYRYQPAVLPLAYESNGFYGLNIVATGMGAVADR